jgi:hypothetical protein
MASYKMNNNFLPSFRVRNFSQVTLRDWAEEDTALKESSDHQESNVPVWEPNEGPTNDHQNAWQKNQFFPAKNSGQTSRQNRSNDLTNVDNTCWKKRNLKSNYKFRLEIWQIFKTPIITFFSTPKKKTGTYHDDNVVFSLF